MATDSISERIKDGVYDVFADQLTNMGNDAFANCSFGPPTDSDDSPDFYRIVTERGASFIWNSDKSEFSTVLFGQIVSSSLGTIHSAKGNHYGGNGEAIKDDTVVKDVLVLGLPTNAPEELATLFYNQIATYNEMREYDEEDENNRDDKPKWVTEPLKSSSSDPAAPMDLIAVTMPPKYTTTQRGKPNTGARITKKLPRRGKDNAMDVDEGKGKAKEKGEGSKAESNGPKVEAGATYDPNLLPDHRGDYFQHPKARLIQQDYTDINKNLIAPWKTYEALPVGTVVLINAAVNCWKMKVTSETYRKVYQFNARSLRVIAESDAPPDIPPVPMLSTPKASSSPTTPSPSKRPRAFDDFEVSPSKKKSPAKPKRNGASGSGTGSKP